MIRHRKKCEGVYNLECPGCGKRFYRRDNYRDHMQRIHHIFEKPAQQAPAETKSASPWARVFKQSTSPVLRLVGAFSVCLEWGSGSLEMHKPVADWSNDQTEAVHTRPTLLVDQQTQFPMWAVGVK